MIQMIEFKRKALSVDLQTLEWKQALQFCKAYLSPQAYGIRIEKKLIEELELTSVPAKADRGDARYDQIYLEIKSSLEDPNCNFALVQIRTWQNIQAYLLIFIPHDFDAIVLLIPADDMHQFAQKYASNAHMANNNNKKRELRLTVTPDILNKLIKYKI